MQKVYELIVRRFLAIFYPPAVFDRITLTVRVRTERFIAQVKTCREKGYLEVMEYSFFDKKRQEDGSGAEGTDSGEKPEDTGISAAMAARLRKNMKLTAEDYTIKKGETSPPKRYNSGSIILAMENAGQLIEEEELREQIRGSGIGTSATRAEILKKLVANRYLALNKKTQIITPTQLGEMIYDTVDCSIRSLLDPKLTASWEMGLTRVAEGTVTEAEYLEKLNGFVARRTNYVKESDFGMALQQQYRRNAVYYKQVRKSSAPAEKKTGTAAGTGSRRRRTKKTDGKADG